jgi:PAS domain-containing protein
MAFKISDFSPVAHFAINEHLILTQWNSALEHLTGMPASHVQNTNRHQEDFPLSGSLSLADAIIKSTSTDELEAVLRTTGAHPCPVLPDAWIVDNYERQLKGVHRHLQLMAMPIRDNKGNKRGAVQAVLDITNTKNAEEQLKRSHQNFVALAENIGDGFLLNQDEVFILVNKSFATLLGYSHPEEIIGRGVEELIAPTHREDFSEKHKGLLNGVHI